MNDRLFNLLRLVIFSSLIIAPLVLGFILGCLLAVVVIELLLFAVIGTALAMNSPVQLQPLPFIAGVIGFILFIVQLTKWMS